ncbi:adenine deaminase [Treponema sp.]
MTRSVPYGELAKAALALIKADLNIVNCTLVDILGGTLVPHSTVSILKGVVVGVNDDLEAERSIDAEGRFLSPGFIDAHVHIESSLLSPSEYARLVVPRGTTVVIADPHEIENVLGYDGMTYMLRSSEGLPLDVYLTVPSCVPATGFDTSGATFYASDMFPFVRDERVLGLGEMMNFPGLLAGDATLLDKIALFHDAGKAIDGHAPGLRGRELSAYIAAGISTDHEATSAEEAREKVSKGMMVMIREGSAARDLDALAAAITPRNARRFLLCSDDRHANDLLADGHIDRSLRMLVQRGVDPLDALGMASINAARHYGLRSSGAIAPGYKADFVLLDSLESFAVSSVYKAGTLVAQNGEMVVPLNTQRIALRDSVNIKWLEEPDFRIKQEGKRIRVIAVQEGSIVTGEKIMEPLVDSEGYCQSDVSRDLLKIFVIERHRGSSSIGKGFITGLGLKRGAIGSTISHDSHNMIVVGVDDDSIFKAARHLNKIGGGLVATMGDELISDLALPIAGLMSDKSAAEVVEALEAFSRHFTTEGLTNSEPLMTLSFMALPVIPKLKITDQGLVDVEAFKNVELFLD